MQEANSSAINVNEILHSKDVISFPKFAATNFTGNVSYRHSTKKLHQPLLELSSPGDQLVKFSEDFDRRLIAFDGI